MSIKSLQIQGQITKENFNYFLDNTKITNMHLHKAQSYNDCNFNAVQQVPSLANIWQADIVKYNVIDKIILKETDELKNALRQHHSLKVGKYNFVTIEDAKQFIINEYEVNGVLLNLKVSILDDKLNVIDVIDGIQTTAHIISSSKNKSSVLSDVKVVPVYNYYISTF